MSKILLEELKTELEQTFGIQFWGYK